MRKRLRYSCRYCCYSAVETNHRSACRPTKASRSIIIEAKIIIFSSDNQSIKQHDRKFIPIITARSTIVQSAVLRSHIVCPSVRQSVRPSVRDVGGSWPHRTEIFETNFTNAIHLLPREYGGIFGSPWLYPRLLLQKFLMGFCSDWAYKCACKIWIS